MHPHLPPGNLGTTLVGLFLIIAALVVAVAFGRKP
jgi:hypothetical protein